MSVTETEVSHELREFFRRVVDAFWMRPDDRLENEGNVFPIVNTGTVAHAVLQSHGIRRHGELPKRVKEVLDALPEGRQEIWEHGVFVGSRGEGLHEDFHLLDRFTTPKAVNEFLISDIVKQKLRESFPEQIGAMERQEEVRGNAS
jgi:hypothetical protein